MTTPNSQHSSIVNIIGKLALISIPVALIGSLTWNYYLNDKQTALIALDANNGKYLWSSDLDNDLSRLQSLVVDRDRVYVRVGTDPSDAFNDRSSDRKYRIDAFSTSSGQKLRSFTAPELTIQPNSSPMDLPPLRVGQHKLWLNTLSDRQILAAKNDKKEIEKNPDLMNIRQGKVINIDTQTGKLIWSIDRNWSIEHLRYDGIVTNDSNTALLKISPTLKISIEAYNSATGKRLWENTVATAASKSASPLFRRYRLFANSETIFILDISTKKISGYRWDTGKPTSQISLNSASIQDLSSYLVVGNDTTVYRLTDIDRGNTDNTTITALDPNTGNRRWEIDPSKCRYLKSLASLQSGTYSVCSLGRRATGERNYGILAIDSKTGKELWLKQYPYLLGSLYDRQDLISNSKTVYAMGYDADVNSAVIAVANTDGKQRWQWQPNFRLYGETIAVDDDRFFILASVPRWRLLLGAID